MTACVLFELALCAELSSTHVTDMIEIFRRQRRFFRAKFFMFLSLFDRFETLVANAAPKAIDFPVITGHVDGERRFSIVAFIAVWAWVLKKFKELAQRLKTQKKLTIKLS